MLELKQLALKLLSYAVPFVVRWFYKRGKFLESLHIEVRSAGDGVTFDCGELPAVRMWLRITNLSPLEVEFDRLYGQIVFNGVFADFLDVRKWKVAPASIRDVFLQTRLNELQLAFKRRQPEAKILLGGYVVSRVHSSEINRDIHVGHIAFVNAGA